jgi:redox-sensitive bicupin YhaK (pirin superfamily)
MSNLIREREWRAGPGLRPPVTFTNTVIAPGFLQPVSVQHFPAGAFPRLRPIEWLSTHFAVGASSPLHRLGGMQTAHMTTIAPHNGFTWHPHRALEIYTWVLDGTIYHEDTTGGKGEIGAGDLQRMFSGDLIYHQELNPWDDPVRVIQIWFAVDPEHAGLEPHYQQLSRDQLPARRTGDATVRSLIGGDSPMEQHMTGRLTATVIDPGGTANTELPRPGEDLFLYVTDGAGVVQHGTYDASLAQYDVLLARPDAPEVSLSATPEAPLNFLSFYLPSFLSPSS